MAMLPKERVRAAFEGKPTDRVPIYNISFSSEVASRILGREAYVGGGIQRWREARALWEGEEAHKEYLERTLQDAFDVSVAVGHDLVRLQYWRMPEKPTKKIDEHTYLYGDPDGEWRIHQLDPVTEMFEIVDQRPKPSEDFDYEWLEEYVAREERGLEEFHPTAEKFASIRDMIERFGKEHALRIAGGSLEVPYHLSIWLEATLLRPDLVGRHLDVEVERALRSMEHMAAAGVEYMFGGGDMASKDGPFYSPRVFDQLMLPRLKRIAEACHRHGMFYLFGSDGNLWPVADSLFGKSGVDGHYELDGSASMDLAKVRERFPHLTLIGNISSITLHTGTPHEVVAETEAALQAAKDGLGMIVGVSNLLMPGTPQANLDALFETMERCR